MDCEEKEKDRILQKVNDAFESVDWGKRHERVVIKFVLKGGFHLMEPEIDLRLLKKIVL